MKLLAFLAAVLFSISCLTARADQSVFGNTPEGDTGGFSLVTYNQLSLSGGAVEFTPLQNLDLTSVSLWLSGYTGQFGQDIYANIWLNNNSAPSAPYISLASPTHNNGSLAEFTFSSPSANPYEDPSGSLVLSAYTSYWLVVTSGGQPGNYENAATWVDGGTPTGLAAYDGSDIYNVYNNSFNTSSTLPAFSINSQSVISVIQPLPEPGVASLMSLPLMLGIGRALYRARKSRK